MLTFGISNLAIQKKIAILEVLLSFLLMCRSILPVLIIPKTMLFFSRRSPEISNLLSRKLSNRNIFFVKDKFTQESLFSFTIGVLLLKVKFIKISRDLILDSEDHLVYSAQCVNSLLFVNVSAGNTKENNRIKWR